MGSESVQFIGPAFAKTARRGLLVVGVVAVAGFAVTTQRLLHARAAAAVLEKARLCAAALAPGAGGDLSDSVDRLRSRYVRLVAVATLSPTGDLQSVHADEPAYGAAAAEAVQNDSSPAVVTTTTRGISEKFWAVAVPLNGSPSPNAWRAVFLIRRDSPLESCLVAMGWFAAMVAAALGINFGVLTRRFDRDVVAPLRILGRIEERFPGRLDRPSVLPVGRYHELQQIADNLRRLAEKVEKHEARTRQAKYDAEQQLRRRETRWDQRLRRAEDQAGVDPLTGLRNRRFLDSELERLFEHQRTRNQDLAIIMVDVDNFKSLNDTYGHEAGDEVLCFLGELLQAAIRPGDYAVRYGGDEFLLVLPQVDGQQAAQIVERIVKLFGQYMSRHASTAALALSAGVASLRVDGSGSGIELIRKADHALYEAKRNGKSAVSLCPGT